MGRRGPKAEPAAVKSQKAAVRSKREAPPRAPAGSFAAGDRAKPPTWLKGRGLDIWARLAPQLVQAKLLGPADEMAFGRYCRDFGAWLDLRDQLDRDGYAYEAESYAGGAKGEEGAKVTTLRRLDPRFSVSDRLERHLESAEDRFGLNPSERQRIMAARLNTGVVGDLFDTKPAAGQANAPPITPAASPVGMLVN